MRKLYTGYPPNLEEADSDALEVLLDKRPASIYILEGDDHANLLPDAFNHPDIRVFKHEGQVYSFDSEKKVVQPMNFDYDMLSVWTDKISPFRRFKTLESSEVLFDMFQEAGYEVKR